ncbi:MAG: arsenosugar biosynthesis radical SAM protein ArsS [Flavobacteriales bacterium]|nr:arsenosugar biosynthesis radical SAM protein ArsS [Flavobacteriales bacterium]
MSTPTLHRKGSLLAAPGQQLSLLEQVQTAAFTSKLKETAAYPLRPNALEVLQLNLGYQCNQTCAHCHVDAGPDRKEVMSKETMEKIVEVLSHHPIATLDLTGGAPEMNPNFRWFVETVRPLVDELIVRSNLTIFSANARFHDMPAFFAEQRVRVISSLPCYTEANTDRQRGNGVFQRSIEALRQLNRVGYAQSETGLELDLVFNPQGTSLPGPQAALEADYKRILKDEHDLSFDRLFCITNLPISRFLDSLVKADRLEEYMQKLVDAFNPSTIAGLMCRNTLSVGWNGRLYDCDFNQMLDLEIKRDSGRHIDDLDLTQLADREIVVHQHCFGCTAGEGSSCQGTLV